MAAPVPGGAFCCDPFKRHKKPVTKGLREIKQVDAEVNSALVPGLYWCDNCRKNQIPKHETTGFYLKTIDSSNRPSTSSQGIDKLESHETICCDPFKRHKGHVKKNLRKILETDVSGNPALLIGLWWCDSCRKYSGTVIKEEPLVHKFVEVHSSSCDTGEEQKNVTAMVQGLDCSAIKIPEGDEKSHVSGSEPLRDMCCDPFGTHTKPVVKFLREIRESDVQKFPDLTVGKFWCDNCRKSCKENLDTSSQILADTDMAALFSEIAEELACGSSGPSSQDLPASQSSASSGSPSLSPAVQKEAAQRSLLALGLSPVITGKLRTHGQTVLAAKRKLQAASDVVRKKLCRSLNLEADELLSAEAIKSRNHDLLMEEIRKRLPSASKLQKYQLLSLVPLSMSINEAMSYFGVSWNLFSSSRKMKVEKGILPVLEFTRSSTVSESTKKLVEEYFCREDNCKVLPGTRDCVSIGKGIFKQKRLLLSNLPELYQQFKEEYKDLKIGLTTFSSLKPKWCVFAGGAGTHEQCICQMHQNFKLILYALNIKQHYRELIKLCVCDPEDRCCMLRLCEKCPTYGDVLNILKKQIVLPVLPVSDCLSSDDEYFHDNIKFRQWKSTDRTEMVVQISTRSELLNTATEQMLELIRHDFIASSQRDYVKKLKEDLPIYKATIQMDFTMNFNCLIQGAVPSYHWSPQQATIHPTVVSYKDELNVSSKKSIIFISDDLEHDVPLVNTFQEKTATYIKENLPHITEVEYVTDGCASQYKSKGYFLSLCRHEEDFGLKASHTYFATSHGKSQCDADGGSVKRKARIASLQRPYDKQIINAYDLYQFCKEEQSEKFIFQFVKKSEVETKRKNYREHIKQIQTLPGTRSFHYIRPMPGNVVACWIISKDQHEDPALLHSLYKQSTPELSISNGMYAVVRVAKQRFVAQVTDVFHQEAEADVTILMPRFPAKEFYWPSEMKTATVPLPSILCALNPLEVNEKLILTEQDLKSMYDLKVLLKKL